MVDDGLTAGHEDTPLGAPWVANDALFANQRLDGGEVSQGSYEHCTFVRVSFKDAEIKESRFRYCTFIDCYFRGTRISESDFVGSRFIDCLFPKTELTGCDFRYARFDRCSPDPGEMRTNLPAEANLREELATRLAVAADGLGASRDARKYRLEAIQARQQHLKEAFYGVNTWYRNHFIGLDKVWAGVRWIGSLVSGWLWGHGERWPILARNLLLLTFLILPLLFAMASSGLSKDSGPLSIADYLSISLASVLSAPHLSAVDLTSTLARVISAVGSFLGIVSFGLFITMIFGAVTRR